MKKTSKCNIKKYYDWLLKNPKKANQKIVATYKMLVDMIDNKRVYEYINKETGEKERKVYYFNYDKANWCIDFIEQRCKHSKGKWAGKPIKLELWQKAFLEAVYGFVDEELGLRKYKKVVLFVAKKNGKSTIDSGISLYGLTNDNEGGAEIYSLATTREQSKIVWTEAKRMVCKSPVLRKGLRTTISGIYYDRRDAIFQPLASETNSLDGKNPFYVIADEVWAWKDMGLLDIMEDGMSAREQPLLLETSTMGTVRGRVFDNEYEYCERVIKGYQGQEGGIVDETILPIIYELDSADEWLDEECWYKANPNLTVSKSLDYMRDKVQKAKNNPIALTNLLCKDFNIRQVSNQCWLTYEELNCELTYEDFKDCYCIGGCDLSSTTDLTCATLLAVKNNQVYVKQMYFIPEAYLDRKVKEDKIPYDKWKALGYLRTSEGAKVNYSDVTNWFIEEVEKNGNRPLWVGYDSWNAQYWKDEMKEYGFEMVEVRQGAKTMSAPMKSMKADLIDKKVNYNNNPILKWCLSNLSVKADDNENIRPIKEHLTQRIDGAVSLIDAYVIYFNHKEEYENYVRS